MKNKLFGIGNILIYSLIKLNEFIYSFIDINFRYRLSDRFMLKEKLKTLICDSDENSEAKNKKLVTNKSIIMTICILKYYNFRKLLEMTYSMQFGSKVNYYYYNLKII